MRRRAALAVLSALVVTGCGSRDDGPDYRLVSPGRYVGAQPLSTPPPGEEPDPSAKDAERIRPVIAAWADAVRHGRPVRAARYFALPTVVSQPSYGPVAIES